MSDRRTDLAHVTDILQGAGLVDTTWMTEYARDRGTAVHLAVALHNENDLDEESLDDDCAPYLAAYKAFLRDARPEVITSEQDVENTTLRYCGRVDLNCTINGRWTILDYKCGAKSEWHRLQLSGYAGCFQGLPARCNLYLRPDGTYRLVEHKNHRTDWEVFKAVLTVYNFRRSAA